MKFHQLFLAAWHEPKKLAAFRLLPIGRVIRYAFLFIVVMTLISFTRFSLGDAELFEASTELNEYSKTIGGLIYPIAFLFQFVIATFYVFVRISIFATIAIWIGNLMGRRTEYRHLWRTTAISMTVPLLLTIIFDFLQVNETWSILLTSIIHIGYLTNALKYYPKSAKKAAK
ncbi:DUF1189 domain-containing protein [Sporosarcina sp. ACRSL]|uniref:DUF1189 family protein n=1 Tax=Sporosarcina sp. ACRSL TaxID=2918215 RepID=UPI001EF443AD|nr:DUF1189 family protein [Sporosarcina sp. ACRSL]MCG7345126.1 DUF1189 domain-containing protein [Sporosarcina sp. ACRSL]